MRIPTIRGVIERRILVNYRVEPNVLAATLPRPFRPKLVHGVGMAGICLIRLRSIRPRLFPAWLGVGSENAAHRVAVEWDDGGRCMEGVYVRRRDTNSRFNTLAGGRLFPGVHHHAKFAVEESGDEYSVSMRSDDGAAHLTVCGRRTRRLAVTSIFHSPDEASAFFQAGSLGYSATGDAGRFEGLELRCRNWELLPLAVEEVRSSVFDNPIVFPPGSAAFDSAFVMREIEHEWHGRGELVS